MNSILESDNHLGISERAGEPQQNNEVLQAAELFEETHASEADNEDVKFVSELGWLAAAAVTIASVAASIGVS